MKKHFIFVVLSSIGFCLFAQANSAQISPGAEAQLAALLNKPALVKPAAAKPLGKNWFTLETDAHVFTDKVSFRQVAAVLQDLDNHNKYYDGKKSKLRLTIVSRRADETVCDFVSVSVGPLNIQVKTSYRAVVKILENTDTRFLFEARQNPDDSNSNKEIKNLFTTRYAEEVTIGGKKYTYIRFYAIDDVNASILPGAQRTLENNSGPVNEEALLMIIEAAKAK